jgi:hypothetical protein
VPSLVPHGGGVVESDVRCRGNVLSEECTELVPKGRAVRVEGVGGTFEEEGETGGICCVGGPGLAWPGLESAALGRDVTAGL